MSKLATIPLASADEALALSRGLFKDLIKTVNSKRAYTSILSNRPNPEYGKQTVERLAPIESFLRKRKGNTNPQEMVSQAVRTGMLDGKKLSSQERRDLGARLQILDTFATGNVKPTISNPTYVSEPSDFLSVRKDNTNYGFADAYRALAKARYYADKLDSSNLADKRAQYLYSTVDNVYQEPLQDLTFTNRYALDEIINEPLTGYKSSISMRRAANRGSFARMSGIQNNYNNKMQDMRKTVDTNRELVKQNITDPKVTETIQALYPDWTGSLEDLVALARMLNP